MPRRAHRRASRRAARGRFARPAAAFAVALTAALLGACSRETAPATHLADVSGHLPDLQFSLTADNGQPVTGENFRGHTTFVYFGYTHCPDVCPETMARLMQVLAKLGPDARNVRILFVSVDPARDTPEALHAYVGAFDPQHAVGLTGTERQIESVARRYRVAYQTGQRTPDGGYEVTHSSAVYVFDARGHARLLATDSDTPDLIAGDVRRVIDDTR